MRDKCAIVGVGATDYYKRGQSYPETELSMACTAIVAALDDAGLGVDDLDGFSIYSASCDPATVGAELGVPEIRAYLSHIPKSVDVVSTERAYKERPCQVKMNGRQP